MQKSIYLDSNDFSDLSRPEDQLRPEDAAVLAALRTARNNGTARILLSPPLLSEAVHASETSKEFSLRRASLMRELCDRNFLRYPTDVCKLEFDQALLNAPPIRLSLDQIVSGDGQWFGNDLDVRSLREMRLKTQQGLHERVDQQRLPRTERRKLKSQLNLSKPTSRRLLRQMIGNGKPSEFQNDFPLNLIDQNQFIAWLLGEKTDFDLHKQLHGIMSDPYILFEHIVDMTGNRDQLYNLVRSPGAKLSASLEDVGQNIIRLCELATDTNQDLDSRDLADQMISKSFLREVAAPLSERQLGHLSDDDLRSLVQQCPSVSTLFQVTREYFHTYIQSNFARFRQGNTTPTKTKISDFGDLMHLFYLPYVDIFRCDARFGEFLRSNKAYGNRVASRRGDLLRML
jgi:hypothetical protein